MLVGNFDIAGISWKPEPATFESHASISIIEPYLANLKELFKPSDLEHLKSECIIFINGKTEILVDQSIPIQDNNENDLRHDDFVYLLAYKVLCHFAISSNIRQLFTGEIECNGSILAQNGEQEDCRNCFLQTLDVDGYLIFYCATKDKVIVFQENDIQIEIDIPKAYIVRIIIPPHSVVFIEASNNLVESLNCSVLEILDFEVRPGFVMVEKSIDIISIRKTEIEALERGIHKLNEFIVCRGSTEFDFIANGKLIDKPNLNNIRINGFYSPVCRGEITEYKIEFKPSEDTFAYALCLEAKSFSKMQFLVYILDINRKVIAKKEILTCGYLFLPKNSQYLQLFVNERMHSWFYFLKECAKSAKDDELITVLYNEIKDVGLPIDLSLEEILNNFKNSEALPLKPVKAVAQLKKGSIQEKSKTSKEENLDVFDTTGFKYTFTIMTLGSERTQNEAVRDFDKDIIIDALEFKLTPKVRMESVIEEIENPEIDLIRDELLERGIIRLREPYESVFQKTLAIINSRMLINPKRMFTERTAIGSNYSISDLELLINFDKLDSKFDIPSMPKALNFCNVIITTLPSLWISEQHQFLKLN